MEHKEIRTEKNTSESPVKLKSGYIFTTQKYDMDESRISIINDKIGNTVSKENTFVGLVVTHT